MKTSLRLRLNMTLRLTLTLMALLAGCGDAGGGGSDAGDGTTGTFSCDSTCSGARCCTDYSWSGGLYPTTAWATDCMNRKGTAGIGCSHTGAVGGCQTTGMSRGVTLSNTSWYYSGSATALTDACVAAKGTWVGP